MPSKFILTLAAAAAAPPIGSATTFGYYRSVFCDAQSADFLIEGYASPISMSSDKMCHQTPAGTMAMKIDGGLEENCVILAYDDYGCTNLVGSVPASGKCVAATKARIGSWQAMCNVTSGSPAAPAESASTSYASGELKRRGKARLPKERAEPTTTSTVCLTNTTDDTKTASSIVSEISSAISASAGAIVTTAASAGAGLSSAISSGTAVAETYNLTSYATDTAPAPSMTTTAAPISGNGTNGTYASPKITTTATYSGKTGGNGTVALAHGGAGSLSAEGLGLFVTGLALVMGTMMAL